MSQIVNVLSEEALNIDSLKTAIKQYLIDNSVISDVDYDGSSISVLINMLAYLVYNVNATTSLNVNQVNLLLSDLRANIIADAKRLNYNITRRISSKMNVTLTIIDTNSTVVIPKWSKFTSGDYTFLNTSEITLNNTNQSETIELIEGEFIDFNIDSSLRFTATAPTAESFLIGYKDVENDNVFVRIKKDGESEFTDYFTKVSSKLQLSLGNDITNFFDEYEAETGYVTIYTSFIDNGFVIQENDVVDYSFLISSGANANGLVDLTSELDTFTITINSASQGGQDEESSESIKANAPLFYNSNNVLVSEDDYNTILEKNSLVERAVGIGGETLFPIELGYTYMSIIPQDEDNYITSLEEATLLNYLNNDAKTIIATVRKFKHPNYIDIDYDIQFIGDIANIDEKKADIEEALTNYFNDNQNRFTTSFFENKINDIVETFFSSNSSTSSRLVTKPKFLLSSELFEQDENVAIYIPNSPTKYYLVKDGDKIPVPENDEDLYSYLQNGWTKEITNDEDLDIDFSGTVNGKTVTLDNTPSGVIDINGTDRDIFDFKLDAVKVAEWIPYLNRLKFTTNIISDLTVDEYVNISYSPAMNVVLEKSSVIRLGTISYL